ncbi:uroporphyrinogen decarboxylase [Alkalibaculum sp. M08DMB]|uniref:Uroporphyrinogen decarboxylase n=1 Tax=Alkalibaculum sporogenes TaxID=2655001 RepID=A0A6A7KB34_9FIRM|nr:uroporphyrinogen decarboxylase [Alkalibaculum sporogenes]MPW26555.1 uroporphyrinogen decarboxylase [Alkalibaculum sporogenes]
MNKAQKKKEERTKLFEDVYSGIIPERVPIGAKLTLEATLEYSNISVGKTLWNMDSEEISNAIHKVCEMIPTDTCTVGGIVKTPHHFKILGSKGYYMSKTGYMQHADVETLYANEYKAFIQSPYDFIVEKCLPRNFKNLEGSGAKQSLVVSKALKAYYDHSAKWQSIIGSINQEYGYFTQPAGSATLCQSSFDFIGDFLRSVKGIYMDVRKQPEMIIEACEAMMPMQVKRGLPNNPHKLGHVFMPLHLGTYLRRKDFEKLYWPSFSKFINIMAEHGQTASLFCEHDWMRYLDLLQELPENTRILFEYGDPKEIKEKLGKRHILSGLYPITYLKTATKQQCIDKAKELIDIMAPGGKYVFDFDKSAMSLDTINIENFTAVIEYVAENTKYHNAGQLVNDSSGNNSIKLDTSVEPFSADLYTDWSTIPKNDIETQLASDVNNSLQQYEELLFKMIFAIV